ncbi:MAG: hypothetical protein HY271_17850 [Deltaproteobacteria bacterium]|nr:hypothetical protein [Deltaproteobacteria bacterium]
MLQDEEHCTIEPEFVAFVVHTYNRYQRRHDVATCDDAELVGRLVGLEANLCLVIVSFIDTPGAPWRTVYRHAAVLAGVLSLEVLDRLRRRGASGDVLGFLIWTRRAVDNVLHEILRRLRATPVGLAIVAVRSLMPPDDAVALRQLLRALRVSQLTSFRPEKESDEDLRQDALASALDFVDRHEREITAPWTLPDRIELPALPVPIPGVDARRWDWPALVASETHATAALLLPALRGDLEALPEKVRLALRDHFESWNAQKRSGEEVLFDDSDHASPTDVESDLARRRAVQDFYAEARRRWGDRACVFLDALLRGRTVEEASKRAGVSRQTGHKYLRELKRPRTK